MLKAFKVDSIATLHNDIKADLRDKKLNVCPSGVNPFDCIAESTD